MNNTCDMMFILYYFSTTGYQLVGKKEKNNKEMQQIYLPFTIQNNGQINVIQCDMVINIIPKILN